MSRTNFSGPITAGSIRDTSGTTVGLDVSNRGYVTLTQAAVITQKAAAVPLAIVIPANSAILMMTSYAKTDFTGSINFGTTSDANDLVSGATCAAGVSLVSAETDAQAMKWANVGDKDVQIYIKSQSDGVGVGFIAVTYVQAINSYLK